MNRIEKRNGQEVAFDRTKIEEAVFKALVVTHPDRKRIKLHKVAEVATDYAIERIKIHKAGQVPRVEEIQDIVEDILMSMGEYNAAKNYIKYRYEHKKERLCSPDPCNLSTI